MNISIPQEQIRTFCEQHHFRKLSLFGSVLRDDFRRDSEVDVLVEFEPTARVTFYDMFDMDVELTNLFGRKVDFRTPQELSRYFRQKVLDATQKLYQCDGISVEE